MQRIAPSTLACLLPSSSPSPTSYALPPTSCHTLDLSGLRSVPQLCHGFLSLSLGTFCLSCLRHMPSSNLFAKLTPSHISSLRLRISSWHQLSMNPYRMVAPPAEASQTFIFPLVMFITIMMMVTITNTY